jgi:hypothetical protein
MKDNRDSDGVVRIKKVYCYFFRHKIIPSSDREGWFKNDCGRCGLDIHRTWFRRTKSIPYKFERLFLWLANHMYSKRSTPTYYPKYRAIDQQLKGVGGKHSCGAYSYEGIVSLLEQYKGDGLPEPLLSSLISEDGWIDLDEHPEEIQPMLDQLAKGVTLLQTKQEQDKLNEKARAKNVE